MVDGHGKSHDRRAGEPVSVKQEEPVRLPGVSTVRCQARASPTGLNIRGQSVELDAEPISTSPAPPRSEKEPHVPDGHVDRPFAPFGGVR